MKISNFKSIFNINYYILLLLLIINFSYFLFESLGDYKKIIFYINLLLFIVFFIFNFFYRKEYNFYKLNIKKITLKNKLEPDIMNEILNLKMKYKENHDIYNLFKYFLIKRNLLNKDYSDLKEIFFKMVPEYFIDEVGNRGVEKISLGISLKKKLYVMFIDIIGFTSIAEEIREDKTLLLLNIYFDGIVEIIEEYGGKVDKFLGDGMMVVFEDNINSDSLLSVSIEIQEFMSKFKISPVGKKINIGIGINYGEVILGTIGAKDRMEITLIGDVVNTASKIETLTRIYNNSILFTKNVYDKIKNKNKFDIKNLGNTEIKGKKEKIKIYGI